MATVSRWRRVTVRKCLCGGGGGLMLGRVTMDQTVVDVSEAPEVSAGDVATFIGRQDGGEISVMEFCEWGATIPWDVFCSITKRVERISRGAR